MAKPTFRNVNAVAESVVARLDDLIAVYLSVRGTQLVGQLQGYKDTLISTFAIADEKLRSQPTQKAAIETDAVGRAIDVFRIFGSELPKIARDLRLFSESAERSRAINGDYAELPSGIHDGQTTTGIHKMMRGIIDAEISPGLRDPTTKPVILLDDESRAARRTATLAAAAQRASAFSGKLGRTGQKGAAFATVL